MVEPQPKTPLIEREGTPDEAVQWSLGAMRMRRFDDAARVLKAVLAEFPDHPDALHYYGLLRHQLGETPEAIELVRRAVAVAPDNVHAWNNLGNLLLCVEDSDGAQAAYFKCLELVPDFLSALSNIALLLRHAGHIDEAERIYRQALEANPESAEVLNNLGTIEMSRSNYAAASDLFGRAIALEAGFGQAYRNMGEALHRQGNDAEATSYFWKSIAVNQGERTARKLLVYALTTMGEHEQAKTVARDWLALDPDDPDAQHHFAAVTGENVPERAADAYVERIFDSYASSFDSSLGSLGYQAPEAIAELLGRVAPDLAGAAILDAGCGTGLVGPLVRERAARLDGLDLSGGMLAKAKLRGIYDRLDKAEITAAMAERPVAYDVVLSADTLCYFGALADVLAAAATALKPGGLVLFTVESLPPEDGRPYRLHEGHGRYAHTAAYLDAVAAGAGFAVLAREDVALRTEGGRPVQGYVVALRKP
ncbi:tetratricopeptide repeat protein [Siculibacillus lacustris]|uniref:Tetratricopeptide repeat protein n=1 Tax=Siculibacillus lacustris TaxID=1549641 RepID=A0A4Q9VMB0_9HYPH|nr:tetratricopeptide repeat protein [Siculibacillus lacustris]TBW36599.1 tetratricopeptide repeat protein [Siculibacillus lacustris]